MPAPGSGGFVDHTAGGDILAGEGVTVIAHEYAAEDLRWTRTPTAPVRKCTRGPSNRCPARTNVLTGWDGAQLSLPLPLPLPTPKHVGLGWVGIYWGLGFRVLKLIQPAQDPVLKDYVFK